MAHYAFLDSDNFVIDIIVGKDENELIEGLSPEEWYGNFRGLQCVRTSYNGNIRKNYAGIGYIYDEERDAFIPPKPFASWLLDEETCRWNPPSEYPNDGKGYEWNEDTISWQEISE